MHALCEWLIIGISHCYIASDYTNMDVASEATQSRMQAMSLEKLISGRRQPKELTKPLFPLRHSKRLPKYEAILYNRFIRTKKNTELRGLSQRSNSTDRATVACRRN
jgi:hypothetical protein